MRRDIGNHKEIAGNLEKRNRERRMNEENQTELADEMGAVVGRLTKNDLNIYLIGELKIQLVLHVCVTPLKTQSNELSHFTAASDIAVFVCLARMIGEIDNHFVISDVRLLQIRRNQCVRTVGNR